MIKKIHIVFLCLFLLSFSGTVSAQEIENQTEDNGAHDEITSTASLNGDDVDMYYKDGTSYTVQLTDNGSSIAYENVNITINGKTYTRTTNSSGFVKLSLNLNPGEYDVESTCIFNNRQLTTLNHVKISVMNTTLIGQTNVEVGYKTDKYSVQLLGGNNTVLADKEIVFEIQGRQYKRTTDENGIGSLNINLNMGEYQINAYYLGETHIKKSNTVNSQITVKKYDTKFNAADSILEYKNGKFTAVLLNEKSTPLKNMTVRFSINGCEYKRTTDENGTASLNINLYSGFYNIGYYFDGNEGLSPSYGSSNINVVQNRIAIYAEDVETCYGDSNCYMLSVENILSKKAVDNLDLRVDVYKGGNIAKSLYTKTGSDGIARVILDLKPGDYTLIIKSTNGNYVGQKNVLAKISQTQAIATANDLILNRKGDPYSIEIVSNLTGLPIANEKVEITVSGKTYIKITDNLGIAKLNINLDNGEYVVKYVFDSEGYGRIEGFNKIIRTDCILNTTLEILDNNIGRKGTYLEAKLLDSNGISLKNKEVQFFINGVEYRRTTDDNGIAKLKINLNDGIYSYSVRFMERNLFGQSSANGNLVVNTTPDFSYSIIIPTYETINNMKFTTCHTIKIQYLDDSHVFGYRMGDGYLNLKDNLKYHVTENGLQHGVNLNKQGISIGLSNDNINITFHGKLKSDLNQFSVIGKNQNFDEIISIVLNNEVIAVINISEKYYLLDEIKDYFYLATSTENVNSILKTHENTVKRTLQLFHGNPLLDEQRIDEPYEFIQSYAISKEKIDHDIMKSEIVKALSAEPAYEEYAYELYVAGLITTFASDSGTDELSKELNLTWDKKEHIVLLTRDWLGLSCHSLGDVMGYGDEDNVKNFYFNYGLSFATYEQLGIYCTGNEAVSAVSEIFDGILNENKSFVVENNLDSWVIRLVNSTNNIQINKTTGKVKTFINSIYYLPLKGAVSKNSVWTNTNPISTFGYVLKSFSHDTNGMLNIVSNAMKSLQTTVSYGSVGIATGLPIMKGLCYGGKIMRGAGIIGICYTIGNLVVDYRNNHVSDDGYQYFSYHPNALMSKTIHVLNPSTQYIDSVEIPIENGKVNMDKSIYIDAVTGKRSLTDDEKIKYENYDS